jgi:hypothetical protein
MVDFWRWTEEVVSRDCCLHKAKDTVCHEESPMPATLNKVVRIFPVVSKLHILKSCASPLHPAHKSGVIFTSTFLGGMFGLRFHIASESLVLSEG